MATMVANVTSLDDDLAKEVYAFAETKGGVKALVDSGIERIPRIFIHKSKHEQKSHCTINSNLEIPIIDLGDMEEQRMEITKGIRKACDTWGFFQVINHGIELELLEDMTEGILKFFQQPKEAKMEFHTSDPEKKSRFISPVDMFSRGELSWRDSLICLKDFEPQDVPSIFRNTMLNYVDNIKGVADTLVNLITEGLDLPSGYLKENYPLDGPTCTAHYYPTCPQPELTMGTKGHCDPNILTLLLQDNAGGLQVLQQEQWVDVTPLKGALIVNIGDLFQLLTNDKMKSVKHRVLARNEEPRVSLACFFGIEANAEKSYGPIKELVTDENPAIYREATQRELIEAFYAGRRGETSPLLHFKI